MPNLIALAIPFFFLLMGVELWAASRRRVKLYRFADVIADISCGMTQQIFLVFAVAVITGGGVLVVPKPGFSLPAGGGFGPGGSLFSPRLGFFLWGTPSPLGDVLSCVPSAHHPDP